MVKLEETININIDIISVYERFFHCQIYDNIKHLSWLTTFIYGYPQYSPREELWKQITKLLGNASNPWLLMGDLNEFQIWMKSKLNIRARQLDMRNFKILF